MWQELRITGADPDFAEELLFALGAHAVRQEDAGDEPLLEPPPGATPLWQSTITSGFFEADQDVAPVTASLRELLPDGATLPIECRQIENADWQESWKAHVQPMPFGDGRLWICPSHRSCDAPGAVVVTLDPGLAFGTGTHPSTALCLDWLARQDLRGLRVLDFGCGSGILAIAALKLGAASALAVDIDPQALIATRDNAERNGVSGRLLCAMPAQAVEEPVDIVLANILARPLIELAPKLSANTLPGGQLVLAGLLESQADEVRAAYQAHFSFAPDARLDGWSRIAARRLP